MNDTIIALIAYIAWTMILLLALAVYRGMFNQAQKRDSLIFKADGSDIGALGQRLTRAHLNCVESFPFVAGIMLLAIASEATAITNGLALIVLGSRIAQSIVHVISISNTAIYLRFVFFLVQFGICLYWLFKLLLRFA